MGKPTIHANVIMLCMHSLNVMMLLGCVKLLWGGRGESAFQASSPIVPTFKKPVECMMYPNHTHFNSKLAEIRIVSEHCIGLLKT
ncbi:hypothetical protein PHPALM_8006 [Phytophthora palmivora]|uniref:DDE Tnp4 domain-containing protein n=1 Tax=Phytophthora palmivora TaxID=4796 RepID=A0A2P4YAY7_9STRA|nr:hypothetical protein PHPALM_8006 [Phytophthora palmivora]